MSSDDESVKVALNGAMQRYQGAVDDFDREVARRLGVNETDLRCLELLLSAGSATPRQLSEWLAIATGSVTAMIDRLEKRGYVNRSPHPSDRRSILVQGTSALEQAASALIGPFVNDATAQVADRYSDDELAVVVAFLTFVRGIQERHTQLLRALPVVRPHSSTGPPAQTVGRTAVFGLARHRPEAGVEHGQKER